MLQTIKQKGPHMMGQSFVRQAPTHKDTRRGCGQVSQRAALPRLPLRSPEGFPKCRCQFESVAADAASESEEKKWLVVRGSWLVKTRYYSRMGCGQISQRAALPRLPLRIRPHGPFFCDLRPAACELRLFHEFIAAERRIRRGRPRAILPHPVQDSYPDGWQRRAARYALRVSRSVVVSFESVAAERRI